MIYVDAVRDGYVRTYCTCLSDELTEYRKVRKVGAPIVTIDLIEGEIKIGYPRKGVYKQTASNRMAALGEICKLESPSYRYISFNACVDSFSLLPVNIDFGKWIYLTRAIPDREYFYDDGWRPEYKHDTCDAGSAFMFDDHYDRVVKDTKDWLNDTVSNIIMNGTYSDKQPAIPGAVLREDLI